MSSEEHGSGREGNVVQNGTAPVDMAAGPIDPAITNRPPPPKHKNNTGLNGAEFARFSAEDERRRRALQRGSIADARIAEGILGIARAVRLLCVTEDQSHLGRSEHIEAVRRRLRCGEPGAALLDGHYVLTEDAHTEELALMRRRLQGIVRGEDA